jgi:CheY-like chemotaxis protein
MTDQTETKTEQKQTVMLVDDDKFLLDMYSLKFTQAGYAVQPCFSVEEAMVKLRGGTVPDVIVFDITMPGEDGFVLLQKIRDEKLAPAAKLIALTNSDNEKPRAEEFGIKRYVIKATMIPSEVVAMVKEELAKK